MDKYVTISIHYTRVKAYYTTSIGVSIIAQRSVIVVGLCNLGISFDQLVLISGFTPLVEGELAIQEPSEMLVDACLQG